MVDLMLIKITTDVIIVCRVYYWSMVFKKNVDTDDIYSQYNANAWQDLSVHLLMFKLYQLKLYYCALIHTDLVNKLLIYKKNYSFYEMIFILIIYS